MTRTSGRFLSDNPFPIHLVSGMELLRTRLCECSSQRRVKTKHENNAMMS